MADDELRIRCGAKDVTDLDRGTFSYNTHNPSYIKLKYHRDGLKGINNCNSTATIVADKINLIGNKSKHHNFATNDKDEFINDDNMKDLIQSAQRLPYGDLLVDFLQKFRMAFMTHTHPYSMLPPCKDPNYFVPVQNYNLYDILSDSVRIN